MASGGRVGGAMQSGLRPVIQVLLAVLFLEGGLGILSPLVYTQLARQNVSSVEIGLVNSAYYVAFLAGTQTCHVLIDRVHHVRAFTVFSALAANAALAHIVLPTPFQWVCLHGVLGYAYAGLAVVIESWLNDKATDENRGAVFGTYMGASWAASGLGPLAIAFQDRLGVATLFVAVTMLMTTGLVPMALTTVGNPDIEGRTHLPFRRLFRASPTGVMACFVIGLSASAYYGLLPSYAAHVGISNTELAWLLSGMTIAGFIMQFPIGRLSDHIGRRPLIVASTGVAAVVALVISLFPTSAFLPSLIGFMALSGAMAPLYALGVGQTNDYVAREEFVAASAGLLFIWALGASCGPVVAGELMDQLTPHCLFWYVSATMGAMCLFTIVRLIMRKALSVTAQGNYVPSPITPISASSQGAPALDPRSIHKPKTT
jgi:MFS family permease